MTLPPETWKKIQSYPDYEISDKGKIRSALTGFTLKPWKVSAGYLMIRLYKSGSDKRTKKHLLLHRLVAEVFIGVIPPGKQVNHKDGNKYNNTLENLEIVSASANMKHAVRIGLVTGPRGERSGTSKLTQKDVDWIRVIALFIPIDVITQIYSVNSSTIYSLLEGRTWKTPKSVTFSSRDYHKFAKGEKHYNSKFTENQIELIRVLSSLGIKSSLISHTFNISYHYAKKIMNKERRTWEKPLL